MIDEPIWSPDRLYSGPMPRLDYQKTRVSRPQRRAEILSAATEAVTVDRAATHGKIEDTFAEVAKIWSARLGVEITPAQVTIMMVDLKGVRAWRNPAHDDNWVDIAGYAACGGELSKPR